ncbi:exodeoxyribonuclease VII large subunit [Negadavirga shengliensis]|uniref:Exodeoxyribonuclease 7 large subunit n=1 Tax=Negadavirga shengliensis TaxID=1389218 RepID=A0ABV9T667_9BACT
MQNPITLLSLNELIKSTLDSNLSPAYWVIAEISEFRDSIKGHAYLELVEKTDDRIMAKMRANIWAYTYQTLRWKFETVTGQSLKSGMKILALVNVQFHEIYGISLIIKDIDPNFTLGERAKRKQEIIDRLHSEGLMTLNKQFELPRVPQKVAVISSVTAAGYGDFINQVEHNHYGYQVHWKLYQATMQGNDAPTSVMNAIEAVEADMPDEKFDLLVIIRGGGAQTDLDCFDDYELARTIANAALPVVTGIGHERDESVADIVAHTQMKTPTAVAELILSGFRQFEEDIHLLLNRIERICRLTFQSEHQRLYDKTHLIKNLLASKLNEAGQRLDRLSHRILLHSKHKVSVNRLHLQNMAISLRKIAISSVQREKQRLGQLEKITERLDPVYLLRRGYTKTEIDGLPINKVEAKVGKQMVTYSWDKKIHSSITEVENYDKKEGNNEL